MALPVWPASLPTRPQRDGTSIESLFQPPIETEMEDGPPRARPRSVTRYGEVVFGYALTEAQFVILEAFIRDDLNRGAAAFTMPVWKPGLSEPFPARTVRISYANGGPKFTAAGTYVFVSLPLRVRDY